jgi:RNA polymerase sigma-70 factor (sigma-E family)
MADPAAPGRGAYLRSTSVERAGEWTADEAVTHLFAAHYRPLVRLATLLLREPGAAEEIVQDAYVALHAHWRRVRDPDKALPYLRTTVVNRCRSALRHRRVVQAHLAATRLPPDAPSAEAGAMRAMLTAEVIAALRGLPARQREALVLRYYADLSEGEIAEAMGCSRGAVKSHTARGMAALRHLLERPPSGRERQDPPSGRERMDQPGGGER